MDEAELVDRFNRKNTLCDVETGDVFGECVILYQHRHEIASRQELHDQIEVGRILEGVVELHDPW